MKLEIFGPNLRDQSKGQFHVHAADCGDCKHYVRNGKFGGEGGWPVEASSQLEVSEDIHCDILSDYGLTPADAEGKAMLLDWLSEVWFAPCCQSLPAETDPIVFECWTKTGMPSTFVKFSSPTEVQAWMIEQLPTLGVHDHLHVVPHRASDTSASRSRSATCPARHVERSAGKTE